MSKHTPGPHDIITSIDCLEKHLEKGAKIKIICTVWILIDKENEIIVTGFSLLNLISKLLLDKEKFL